MSGGFIVTAKRCGITAALGAVLSLNAQTDVIRQSQDLLSQGKPADAFKLLSDAEVQQAGDIEFDLALGAAANAAGEFTRAIIALERVLAVQPGNERARAELGRALYGVGDHKGAKQLLSESRQQGLTAIAGEPVEQMLHAIDRVEAEGKSSARAYLEATAGWDSNINSAPGVSSVAVPAYGGSVLAIDPAGAQKKGAFASFGAGASGRYVLGPRASVIGSVSVRRQDFTGVNSALRNASADMSVGYAYRVERNEFSLAGQIGTYSIGSDTVRDYIGIAGEWTYRFDGFRQVNTYIQSGRLKYPQQRIADANRHVAGFTFAHLSTKGTWTYGGAYAGTEDTLDSSADHLGHKLFGARGGMQMPLTASLGLFVAAGWERRRYGGRDPLFLTSRRDTQLNFSGGASWVPVPGWRLTPQVALAKTDSSVPLARYRKHALSVVVRREF
jgi:tetratricopeptide (TPR) repeat protein